LAAVAAVAAAKAVRGAVYGRGAQVEVVEPVTQPCLTLLMLGLLRL
jgi:hypothetical protein